MGYIGLGPLVPQREKRIWEGNGKRACWGPVPWTVTGTEAVSPRVEVGMLIERAPCPLEQKKNEVTPSRLPCAAAIIME